MRKVMRKYLLTTAAVALMATAYAGPAAARDSDIFGTGVGAALGGLLGSQIAHGDARLVTTAAGVFFGGMIGNNLSHSSYEAPRPHPVYTYAAPVEPYSYRTVYVPNYVAPPAYEPTTYAPPTYVAPPPAPTPVTYVDEDTGGYCREYSQTVRVGGRIQESYGTACLQPDGSWRIVR